MTKKSDYQRFISRPEISFWIPIIVAVVGFAVAWGVFQTRMSVNAQDNDKLNERLDGMQQLIERVIVLEEHDKSITEDLTEIKDSLKSQNIKIDQIRAAVK